MANKATKRDFIIFIVITLFLGGGYLYTKYVESDQIKSDFSMTKGKIYELAGEGHEKDNLISATRYKYTVDGKEYERGSIDMDPCEGAEQHINTLKDFEYPIVYNNQDPEKSRLLISPKQFEEYDIPYPESLRIFYEAYWACK